MTISKEKNKKLNSVLNGINKQFGEGSVKIAGQHIAEMIIRRIKTSSTVFNVMLHGGVSRAKIVEFYGPNSSGKTSMALEIIKQFQEENPEEICAWFETEASWDPEYARDIMGIDLDRLVVIDQTDHSAEECLDIVRGLVKSGEFRIIVVNSIAGLSPKVELENELEKANMGVVARMLSKFFRVIIGSANKNDCTFIFINQVRATMDQYRPEATCGGNALSFYATQRVRFSKVKVQSADPIDANDGVKINCSVAKNRAANGKNPYTNCTYYAIYGEGINNVIDVPDIVGSLGIFSKAGAWFNLLDETTGDPKVIEGVTCKFNGKNAFIKALTDNPAFLKAVTEMINNNIDKVQGSNLSAEEIIAIEKENKEAEKQFANLDKEVATEVEE